MAQIKHQRKAGEELRDQELFIELLRRFAEIADKHGIRYWIDWGTLLGIYRDGSLIPGDSDIDVSVMGEDLTPEFMTDLIPMTSNVTKMHLKQAFRDRNDGFIPPMWLGLRLFDADGKLVHDSGGNPVAGDLFVYYPIRYKERDCFMYRCATNYVVMPGELCADFDTIVFHGRPYKKPKNTEAYLEKAYGSQWNVPDPSYSGNPNTIQAFFGKRYRYNHRKHSWKVIEPRVITYGTFDLFHYGHLRLLERAAELGSYLIVGVSTDEFNTVKNKNCVYPYEERAAIVASLGIVDKVIPEENWEQKRTDAVDNCISKLVMGDDWSGKFDHLSDECEVLYLPRTPGIATSSTITNIQARPALQVDKD